MPIKVGFARTINEGSKAVIAISMENTLKEGGMLQAGEKLKAQIDELKERKCDITILVADELQRLNFCLLSDPETVQEEATKKARAMGDIFLRDNIDNKATITQQELDENKPVTIHGCKVIRWKQYLAEKKDQFQSMKELVQAECKNPLEQESEFYKKMKQAFKSSRTGADHSLEHSLNLQIEEYATILCMSEFEHLVYPKATAPMTYVCGPKHFLQDKERKAIKKPNLNMVTITTVENIIKKPKATKPLLATLKPLVALFSQLLNQIQDIKDSSEIAEEHKQNLIEHLVTVSHLYPWFVAAELPQPTSASSSQLAFFSNPKKATTGFYLGVEQESHGSLALLQSHTPRSRFASMATSKADGSSEGASVSEVKVDGAQHTAVFRSGSSTPLSNAPTPPPASVSPKLPDDHIQFPSSVGMSLGSSARV